LRSCPTRRSSDLFANAMRHGDRFYLHVENPPHKPLTIEVVDASRVSVSQNGDLMIFEATPDGWLAISYRNDGLGKDRQLVQRDAPGKITRYTPDPFHNLWGKKLIA